MSRWLALNLLVITTIISLSIIRGYENNLLLIGILLSQVAFLLFLINVNMFFILRQIRTSKIRKVKIRLAKLSKGMMKFHIPIALTATFLIFFHAIIMFFTHQWNIKTASGLLAVLNLFILLLSGLLRRQKATGRRRKFHYTMAFIFFGFVLLHIFL